jgi:hypothetical protein
LRLLRPRVLLKAAASKSALAHLPSAVIAEELHDDAVIEERARRTLSHGPVGKAF